MPTGPQPRYHADVRKLAVSALIFVISCSGGAEAPNLPPSASLGSDAPGGQILLGQEVTFDGSGSYDPDGFIQHLPLFTLPRPPVSRVDRCQVFGNTLGGHPCLSQ